MKVSIITAVRNGAQTIEGCIQSIRGQSYEDIEHIIVDGSSTDDTLRIVERYSNWPAKIISEPDNGIYEALNKGIRLASGDVIGILHADDFYAHDKVLQKVAGIFDEYNVDSCYGDLEYVSKNNANKVIRYWKSSNYHRGMFKYGWMPPHPTFFVKKKIYQEYGYFNEQFRISADYELMLRFLVKYQISTYYMNDLFIKMRFGGTSNRTIKNIFVKSYEDYKAWKMNSLKVIFGMILLKNLSKIPQFIRRAEIKREY